jgi:hypothetical protein
MNMQSKYEIMLGKIESYMMKKGIRLTFLIPKVTNLNNKTNWKRRIWTGVPRKMVRTGCCSKKIHEKARV